MKPKIYFEKRGSGKPLILVHGNKETHHIFDELVAELEDSFTIYAVDSRGHGLSEKVKEYHYADMADDILALIDSEKIEKPYFYGFSDGGIIGLLCAIKRQGVFSKMIVSGANTTFGGLKLFCRIGMYFHYVITGDKTTKLMVKEPNITAEELAKIDCPTLVTAGEFDLVKQKDTDFIVRSIPQSSVKIIKGRDHGNYIIHSTYLKPTILDFFK